MKRFLNIEQKSFEIWTDDYQGPKSFSITERAKGRPHVISFDGNLSERAIGFLNQAKDARMDIAFRETLHLKGAPIFLTRGSNS